jgi:hypothetical protein
MAGSSERAGYTVSLFALDVSPSMAEVVEDAETGQSKSKLDWAKEYIARKMDYKVPAVSAQLTYRSCPGGRLSMLACSLSVPVRVRLSHG